MLRKSMFSGSHSFYPDDPILLNRFFEENTTEGIRKSTAYSVICPHAGYIYSAKTALKALEMILIPNHVILIGPNHTGVGPYLSIMSSGEWEIPGAKVPINSRLAELLIQNSSFLENDVLAQKEEHSLEVIMPMLYYFNKNISFVPIIMGSYSDQYWKDLADSLIQLGLFAKEPFLVIASTDMTHFETRDEAKRKDDLVFNKIRLLDSQGLMETVRKYQISMCGSGPVAAIIRYSKQMGATQAELIDYSDSGLVTKDSNRIVSYASFVLV